jgi:MFS family permease
VLSCGRSPGDAQIDSHNLVNYKRPLSFRDFRYFWVARGCTTLAQSCMIVVIGWQVYDVARRSMDLRHAALWLGLIGLVQFAPLFALTLVTGWVADRVDRRLIVRLCVGTQWLCAATLAAVNGFAHLTLAPLFVVAAALGVARAFYAPAQSAIGPNLVPAAVLPRAIASNSIATRVGAILGPALGGALYGAAPHLPYTVSACLFGGALGCLLMIRPIAATNMDRMRKPWRQMIEGLQYVRRNRLVLGAISLDLFAVLLGGTTALLPIFARDMLHIGPSGLGVLRAAPPLGALLAASWLSFRPLQNNVGPNLLIAVGVYGVATAAFGLSRWEPLSLACLVTLGAADMISLYVRQSLIQLSTPNEMRGRVGAISTMFVSASNELGEAESGFLAALVGPVAAVVIGGVGAVAVAALWSRWFPTLRDAQNFDLP